MEDPLKVQPISVKSKKASPLGKAKKIIGKKPLRRQKTSITVNGLDEVHDEEAFDVGESALVLNDTHRFELLSFIMFRLEAYSKGWEALLK
jgi:hypothetical protein